MRISPRARRPLLVGLVALAAALAFVAVRALRRRAERAQLATVDIEALCPSASPLGKACGACVALHCCKELVACYGAAPCVDLNDCYVTSGEDEAHRGGTAKSRAERCLRDHAAVAPTFLAWDGCARRQCEEECPRGPDEDDDEVH